MSLKPAHTDPRIKRTRQLIRQAFMTLMRKKHIQDVSVQEIAEEAGINRATFYAHFIDKQALMNYAIREALREKLDEQLPAHPTLTTDNLRLLTVVVTHFLAETVHHCSPVRDTIQPMLEAEIQTHVYEVLYGWLEESPYRDQVPPDTAATVLSWSIFGAAMEYSRGKRDITPEQLADRVLPLISAGILSTPETARS